MQYDKKKFKKARATTKKYFLFVHNKNSHSYPITLSISLTFAGLYSNSPTIEKKL